MCSTELVNELYSAIEMEDAEGVRSALSKIPASAYDNTAKSNSDLFRNFMDERFSVSAEDIQSMNNVAATILGDRDNKSVYLDKIFNTLDYLLGFLEEDDVVLKVVKIILLYGKYDEWLIKNGQRLGVPEWGFRYNISMLFVLGAPKSRQKELLQNFIDKSKLDPHYKNEEGDNFLLFTIKSALKTDNIDVVELAKIFLNAGVSVNDTDNNGLSTLHWALQVPSNTELVSIILKRGADVNKKSMFGCFPLFVAAKKNDEDCADLLLSNGADINATTESGQVALHAACFHRYAGMINLLLQRGAHISVEDKNGQTPFFLLEPQKYKESDVSCINSVVKEIAKRKFFNDFTVSDKDLNLVNSHPAMKELFESTTKELLQLSKIRKV